jgi:hypothetical protein
LSYIPFNNIIDYDFDGDEFYQYPHVLCDFSNGDTPYEFVRYAVGRDKGEWIIDDDLIIEIIS